MSAIPTPKDPMPPRMKILLTGDLLSTHDGRDILLILLLLGASHGGLVFLSRAERQHNGEWSGVRGMAREKNSPCRLSWPGSFHGPCLSGFHEPCRAVSITRSMGVALGTMRR